MLNACFDDNCMFSKQHKRNKLFVKVKTFTYLAQIIWHSKNTFYVTLYVDVLYINVLKKCKMITSLFQNK